MEKEILVSDYKNCKIFQKDNQSGFVIDKEIISSDENGDFIQFPLEDVSIRYFVVKSGHIIAMKKDLPDEFDPSDEPLGLSYCFETPTNVWLQYKHNKIDTPKEIKQLYTQLFIPDTISHNKVNRMNWFVSTLGVGPWCVRVDILHRSVSVETTEFTIPAPGTDPKSYEFKQYLSKLKQLGIRRVSKFRF